jgi:hypothetical protein
VPRLYKESVFAAEIISDKYRLIPCSTETGELGQYSKVIEEEMTRRLHSDLK